MPMCLRKEIEVNCMWLEILGRVPHLSLFTSPGTLQSTPFSQWPIPSRTRGHHPLYVIWPAIILWTPCNKQPWTLSTNHMMESETVTYPTENPDRGPGPSIIIAASTGTPNDIILIPTHPLWILILQFWSPEYFCLYTCSINIWPKRVFVWKTTGIAAPLQTFFLDL